MGCFRLAKAINSNTYLLPALLGILLLTPCLWAQERQRAQAEPHFDRVVIDSLDPDAWNGVVFMARAYQQQISFRSTRCRLSHLQWYKIPVRSVLWACLTYNIQQWFRLRWKPRLIAACA
jgi:hypothetical protein